MFEKPVDKTRRETMLEFLKTHYRYGRFSLFRDTMTYANSLNFYNSAEENAKIMAFRAAECPAYDAEVANIIAEFEKDTDYAIEIVGDAKDQLVLCAFGYSKAGLRITEMYGFDSPTSIENDSDDELRDKCDLVCAFDRACDKIAGTLIWYALNTEIEEEVEIIKKVHKIAKVKR